MSRYSRNSRSKKTTYYKLNKLEYFGYTDHLYLIEQLTNIGNTMQDIRLNWFRVIFSRSDFDIALRPFDDQYHFDKKHFGVYMLKDPSKKGFRIKYLICLDGRSSQELNSLKDESKKNLVDNQFVTKNICLRDNYDLTRKLLINGMTNLLKKNGLSIIPQFKGISVFNPKNRTSYGDYLEGFEHFIIYPYFLDSQRSYGIIITPSFRVNFSKSFKDDTIQRVFRREPVVIVDNGNNYFKGKLKKITNDNAIIVNREGIEKEALLNNIYPQYSIQIISKYIKELERKRFINRSDCLIFTRAGNLPN